MISLRLRQLTPIFSDRSNWIGRITSQTATMSLLCGSHLTTCCLRRKCLRSKGLWSCSRFACGVRSIPSLGNEARRSDVRRTTAQFGDLGKGGRCCCGNCIAAASIQARSQRLGRRQRSCLRPGKFCDILEAVQWVERQDSQYPKLSRRNSSFGDTSKKPANA